MASPNYHLHFFMLISTESVLKGHQVSYRQGVSRSKRGTVAQDKLGLGAKVKGTNHVKIRASRWRIFVPENPGIFRKISEK